MLCELQVHLLCSWHSLLGEQPVCTQHVVGVCGAAEEHKKLLLSAGSALRCARQTAVLLSGTGTLHSRLSCRPQILAKNLCLPYCPFFSGAGGSRCNSLAFSVVSCVASRFGGNHDHFPRRESAPVRLTGTRKYTSIFLVLSTPGNKSRVKDQFSGTKLLSAVSICLKFLILQFPQPRTCPM